MTTTPAEVVLTNPAIAVAQRAFAGTVAAALALGMVALPFSGDPWWAIVLWELAELGGLFIMFRVWSSAGTSASETTALRAKGTTVTAEVVSSTKDFDGESVTHELKLWIPLEDGGFEVRHHCNHYRGQPQLKVLVDPADRTWAVVH
ncbi:hypothetical protein JNUCC0626_14555 [Lentzea sp. JNUCC 0626]|uniref:hypothetical protein n=1 Tax=Lentzea sp. JNUCC 0626 TaxID=3367513 RepID=UPI003749FD75